MERKKRLTVLLSVCTLISLIIYSVNQFDGASAGPGATAIWVVLAFFAFKQQYKALKIGTLFVAAINILGLIIVIVTDNQQINNIFAVSSADIFITTVIKLGIFSFIYFEANKLYNDETKDPYKDNIPSPSQVNAMKIDSTQLIKTNDTGKVASIDIELNEPVDSLQTLMQSEEWKLLERYNTKASKYLNEMRELGVVYQALFVERVISQENKDLDAVRAAIYSEFDKRFAISGKVEINDSLRKMYNLYGDEGASYFIRIYNVIGDELNIDKLESDIKSSQAKSVLNKSEQNSAQPSSDEHGPELPTKSNASSAKGVNQGIYTATQGSQYKGAVVEDNNTQILAEGDGAIEGSIGSTVSYKLFFVMILFCIAIIASIILPENWREIVATSTNKAKSETTNPVNNSRATPVVRAATLGWDWFVGDKITRTGKGKYTWLDGVMYEGDFVDDIRSGKGKYTWASGNVYEGDFVDGIRTGKGKYTWANGNVYEGDFLYGSASGKGKYTWANGNVYEGDFVDGKQTGKGKLTLASGGVYMGDFVDGSANGKGKYTWANGAVFEGNFVDNKRTGKARLTRASGNVYEGDFVDGMQTGKGKYTWANGDVYEGDFVDDMLTGKGKYTWANSDVYEGDFVDGMQTGKGKYTWASGNVHIGEFKNDVPSGRGIEVKFGTTKRGIWVDGKFLYEEDVKIDEFK
jgi:hypothetical protein